MKRVIATLACLGFLACGDTPQNSSGTDSGDSGSAGGDDGSTDGGDIGTSEDSGIGGRTSRTRKNGGAGGGGGKIGGIAGAGGDLGIGGKVYVGGAGGGAGGAAAGSGGTGGLPAEFATPIALTRFDGLIVTSEALREPFEYLALIHTLTGVPTEVVTTAEICGGNCTDDPTKDAAHAIKAYLSSRADIRFVLLGGDIEHVPSRQVYDEYTNPITLDVYADYFYSDYYFSDLSEWDGNGNGVYAEDGSDSPEYLPGLAVARLPVSDTVEADRAISKIVHHLTEFNIDRVQTAALMSNVAATLDLGFPLEIDSAWYLETVNGTASLFPRAFSLYKLYSLGPDVVPEAVRLTPELELDALEAGYNLIVHAGHGSENSLTAEQNGANAITVQMLSALNNEDTPFVLSCACLAGDFNFDDSAGEILMNAVAGGAVGYLGNTATGLGLAGGSQLIDEMLSYIFGVRNALIGDALIAGHANFSYPSGMELPLIGVIDTVDKDSWEWTQKAAVYFGDPMLPVWTDPALRTAPSVSVRKTEVGGGVALTFVFNRAVTGTLSFATPGHLYKTSLTNKTRTTVAISEDPGSVVLGFFDDGALFVIRRQEL